MIQEFIIVSVLMFAMGLYALSTRKNLLRGLVGLILLMESSHLLFISFNPMSALTQFFVLASIVLSGCIFAATLALIITIYKRENTIKADILDFETN